MLKNLTPNYIQTKEPINTKVGDLWFDSDDNKYYIRNDTNSEWIEIKKYSSIGSYGYILGNHGYYCKLYSKDVNRIEFPFNNGSIVFLGELLPKAKESGSGCNSSTAGFIINSSVNINYDYNVYKINYSFDSKEQIEVKELTYDVVCGSSSCNSSTTGYICGGFKGPHRTLNQAVTTISKINFSSDNEILKLNDKLTERKGSVATFNSSTTGFFAGGASEGYNFSFRYKTIDKIFFYSDASVLALKNLDKEVAASANFNSTVSGYIVAGFDDIDGNIYSNKIRKINFIDTSEQLSLNELNDSIYNCSGLNSSIAGYVCGGSTNVFKEMVLNVSKIDFIFNDSISEHSGYLKNPSYGSTTLDETDFITQFI